MGVILADSSLHSLWHLPKEEGLLDAILTDRNVCFYLYFSITSKILNFIHSAPYGIRERGQKVGSKPRNPEWIESATANTRKCCSTLVFTLITFILRYPEKTRYNIATVYLDLLNLAVKLLRVGGRLAFWFPVIRSELVFFYLISIFIIISTKI